MKTELVARGVVFFPDSWHEETWRRSNILESVDGHGRLPAGVLEEVAGKGPRELGLSGGGRAGRRVYAKSEQRQQCLGGLIQAGGRGGIAIWKSVVGTFILATIVVCFINPFEKQSQPFFW